MPDSEATAVSTPDPTAGDAQSRESESRTSLPPVVPPGPADEPFELGEGVARAAFVIPYERKETDPLYRPLKIFSLDPATSKLEGSVAVVNVPYEPLSEPTNEICGRVFHLLPSDDEPRLKVNLNDPAILISGGLDPSPSDLRFHHQMVYAVCTTVYTAFRRALGRPVAWGFDGTLRTRAPGQWQLRVFPHHQEAGQNAWYSHWAGELRFGWYKGNKTEVKGNHLPSGKYYTCLSHDIIAHEVSHALLDGLRARLSVPTHIEVLAFHEGFADLVAIFQHFSYDKVVRAAMVRSGGDLTQPGLLSDLATQFGQTTGSDGPLRSAIDVSKPGTHPPSCKSGEEDPHALGSVLVSAIFEAFTTIFHRKTARYLQLAGPSRSTGTEPSPVLLDILSEEASHLASQFLAMCIRAIDYCPPIDLRMGEYLRALITADRDLVPDDQWAFREAIIDAFRRRAVFPDDVDFLSEDALAWRAPETSISIEDLNFANLRFAGDPQHAAGERELQRQARALGREVTKRELIRQFGLIDPADAEAKGMRVDKPVIESIRSTRRVGPQGQIVFDLVAEVTQRRTVQDDDLGSWDFYGGATVILNPRGEIRYVIRKRIDHRERLKGQRDFLNSPAGRRIWTVKDGHLRMAGDLFRLAHELSGSGAGRQNTNR